MGRMWVMWVLDFQPQLKGLLASLYKWEKPRYTEGPKSHNLVARTFIHVGSP